MKDCKKVHNPFVEQRDKSYHCFGCSPQNSAGLQLDFYRNDHELFCDWTPEKQFDGFNNVIHGGIQATLLDEIAGWYVYVFLDTAGVTSSLNVEYVKPFLRSSGKAKLIARLISISGKIAIIECELYNGSHVLCCKATIKYYLYPSEVAKKRYHYPGKEAFVMA